MVFTWCRCHPFRVARESPTFSSKVPHPVNVSHVFFVKVYVFLTRMINSEIVWLVPSKLNCGISMVDPAAKFNRLFDEMLCCLRYRLFACIVRPHGAMARTTRAPGRQCAP